MQNQKLNSPSSLMDGSLTTSTSKNAASPDTIQKPSPINSETITPPAPPASQAGTQLSSPGLATLRNLAAAALDGSAGAISDQNLKASLTSHFGSRLSIKPEMTFGTDEVPECRTISIRVTVSQICGADADVIRFVEALNHPAKPVFLAGKLARMRVSMARRGESDKDVSLLIDTLMELIADYPADAVGYACDHWIRTKKFFPTPSELISVLDEAVMLRRALLAALKGNLAKAIAAPRAPKSWRNLPKVDWDRAMWESYVGDAEGMLKMAKEHPAMLDIPGWQAEVDRRKAQIPAASLAPGSAPRGEAPSLPSEAQNAPRTI